MVVSRLSVRNLFIEKARAFGLLALFTIAEWVVGDTRNMAVNARMTVSMRSRTDSEACTNANYGRLKMHKGSQNFSLHSLFVEETTESSRRVTIRPAVVATARIWLGVSRDWIYCKP